MSFARANSRGRTRALAIVFAAALIAAPPWLRAQAGATDAGSASAKRYREHLAQLDGVVTGCAKLRTAAACNPALVGPDDRVEVKASGGVEQRQIRYDWLRTLLARAGSKEENSQRSVGQTASGISTPVVKTRPLAIDELLNLARQRLAEDAEEASAPPAGAGYRSERASLTAILARREFRGVSGETTRERLMEWLETELNELFGRLVRLGERAPWIALAFRALFLVGVCVGLVWALVRIERRTRIRLVPEAPPSPGPQPLREWQLWLKDARAMAAGDHWREAIHFLYWAAVARLESRHLWAADRARTPREVLRLVPGGDPRRQSLAALTRSFERTWYGGREAGAADYEAALALASALGVE